MTTVRYLRLRDEVEAFFAEGGPLSSVFPGYRPRTGQVAMATAVADVIDDPAGGNLLVEAPTGTGKSFAYGVPAALHVRRHLASEGDPVRVVVATANISLQEQLLSKDLPLLQQLVPGFRFALAKGMSHYLCQAAMAEIGDNEADVKALDGIVSRDKRARRHLAVIQSWASETETGDVSELEEEPHPGVWRYYSRRSEDCTGKACKHAKTCFVRKARTEVREAHVVVANYAVYCLDVAAGGVVLGEHDVFIGDEAHRLGDMARSVWGENVTPGAIKRIVKILRDVDGNLADHLAVASEDLFFALERFARSERYNNIRLLRPLDRDVAQDVIDAYLQVTKKAARLLGEHGGKVIDSSEDKSDADDRTEQRARGVKYQKAARRVYELGEAVLSAAQFDRRWCYAIKENRGGTFMELRELEPSHVLRRMVFAPHQRPRVSVLTSATLRTGGDFRWIRGECGVDDAHELVVATPFDYRRQARLVVPASMPDPRDARYESAVSRHVCEVLRLVPGKVLCLFTAKSRLQHARDTWESVRHAELDVRPVLAQGDGTKQTISRQFRTASNGAVLFGSLSFFEGFDCTGMGAVIIDKVPFPIMHDAVHATLGERIGFGDYSLPRAALILNQGFGRLIRSHNDFGSVVVLDRRLTQKAYGRYLVESLPDVTVSEDLVSVQPPSRDQVG